MNEQNKKLYLESLDTSGNFCYQRFAELVRQDERAKCAAGYLQDFCGAVDAGRIEEREAIAKICDASTNLDWLAKEIRARGEK